MNREEWKPGDRAWFEYHCFESPESADAEAWYRSHQRVTVLGLDPNGEWADGLEGTAQKRADEWATPATYRVRWADGFEYAVFEDELSTSKDDWHRPDPPANRSVVGASEIQPGREASP